MSQLFYINGQGFEKEAYDKIVARLRESERIAEEREIAELPVKDTVPVKSKK